MVFDEFCHSDFHDIFKGVSDELVVDDSLEQKKLNFEDFEDSTMSWGYPLVI